MHIKVNIRVIGKTDSCHSYNYYKILIFVSMATMGIYKTNLKRSN